MFKFLVKKALLAGLTVVTVSGLIIFLISYAPVDPARINFGQMADEKTVLELRQRYYLDKPVYIQIYRYLEDLSPVQVIKKDDSRLTEYSFVKIAKVENNYVILKLPYLRRSYVSGISVSELVFKAIKPTFILASASLLISFLLGLLLGWYSASKRNSGTDKAIIFITSFLYSVPSFVMAIIVSLLFGYYLGWFPIQGSLWDLNDNGEQAIYIENLFLPLIALGLRPLSQITQMTRSAVLDTMGSTFILTANAKGLKKSQIILYHTLKNALNPLLTVASSWFASLLAGAFFIEYVFNFKGMGLLTIQAVNQFDIPLLTGCCIATVCIFISINLLTDLLYAVIDPRVRINN
jgi:peptide/nickel transport system permease protein